MRVAGGEVHQQLCDVLGQHVLVRGIVRDEDLGDAGDLRGGFAGPAAILAGDQDVDVLVDLRGGGHDVARDGLQLALGVLSDDEDAHQITFASFTSFSTSSWTVFTLPPPWRFGGSATLITFRRGVMSAPRSSGDISSIGFFFAFMMFGRDA